MRTLPELHERRADYERISQKARPLKAVTVNHFGFPHAAQVLQVTRKTRDLATRKWHTVVVYAITSLSFELARPARLADLIRGHWRDDRELLCRLRLWVVNRRGSSRWWGGRACSA